MTSSILTEFDQDLATLYFLLNVEKYQETVLKKKHYHLLQGCNVSVQVRVHTCVCVCGALGGPVPVTHASQVGFLPVHLGRRLIQAQF